MSEATLLPDGGTRYETADLNEFQEAIAAAHAEGAKINLKTGEGNGTHVVHIHYPEDLTELVEETLAETATVAVEDDEDEEEDDDEPVAVARPARKTAPSTRKK